MDHDADPPAGPRFSILYLPHIIPLQRLSRRFISLFAICILAQWARSIGRSFRRSPSSSHPSITLTMLSGNMFIINMKIYLGRTLHGRDVKEYPSL